ncbi:MAG: thiamine pyrophosphate-binding protein [Pseudomonadota bacterium]
MTGTKTGAQALIETLQVSGVGTIFGVPGEETTDLMRAIEASGIEFVLCRHEQSAAFMASVHAKLTGEVGVCLSTLGPGATNLVTGVADAHLDGAALLAISGQGSRDRLKRMSHQMIDLEALFAPITKMSRTIMNPGDVSKTVFEALRLALEDRRGAVHISLPEDVASAETEADLPAPEPACPAVFDSSGLDKVAQLINQATAPVVLAGERIVSAQQADALRRFAERANLPLATSFMAKGILPRDHNLTLYTVGQPEDDHADKAIQKSDLVIFVGFDPVEFSPERFCSDGEVISVVIDTVAPRLDAGWQIAAQVIGDMRASLGYLGEALSSHTFDRAEEMPKIAETLLAYERAVLSQPSQKGFHPVQLCHEVSEILTAEDTVLSGVGLHKLWIARHLHPRVAGQLIIPNGLAGMGLALPGSVAAARCRPEGRVFVLCGDGDFMMNVQDMATAADEEVPLTVLLWADQGFGLIDEHQGAQGPDFGFTNPNWEQLAKSFGWIFTHATSRTDLAQALKLSSKQPHLILAPVDYESAGGMPALAAA